MESLTEVVPVVIAFIIASFVLFAFCVVEGVRTHRSFRERTPEIEASILLTLQREGGARGEMEREVLLTRIVRGNGISVLGGGLEKILRTMERRELVTLSSSSGDGNTNHFVQLTKHGRSKIPSSPLHHTHA